MKLGEFFPDDITPKPPEELQIGMVLRLFVKDTNPPKIKRFIIVGMSNDGVSLASVYINSEINEFVNYSIELKSQHLFFELKTREGYLDHDSYVDCANLVMRDYEEMLNSVKKRPEACLGSVSANDLNLISRKIIESPSIKGKYKKKFGFFD